MEPEPQQQSATLVIGLRDFLPAYEEFRAEDAEERFLAFVHAFHHASIDAFTTVGATTKSDSGLWVSTTGDGLVAVFLDEAAHVRQAYAAGMLLCRRLPDVIAEHGFDRRHSAMDSFGVGLEAGPVRLLETTHGSSNIETCVGHAVSVAARLERHTKNYARTPMIIGEEINERLCACLTPGVSYRELIRRAIDPEEKGSRRGLHATMDGLNQQLRVRWMNKLRLEGLGEPVGAFRYSPSLSGNIEAFVDLVDTLFAEQPAIASALAEAFR